MGMTVIVTRNVAPRFRGFLTSCMLEIAPGVYTSPDLNKAVRGRIWSVCTEWFENIEGTAIVMVWQESSASGGQGLKFLGLPPKETTEYQGIFLTRRELPLT